MRFFDRCILWSACVLLFTVCARQTKNEQESKLQQIIFPTGIEYRENGTERVAGVDHCAPYKIVAYYDSISCLSCDFSISEWHELEKELQQIAPGRCEIVLLFSPRFKREVRASMLDSGVKRVVGFDTGNAFILENNLTDRLDDRYFMIDSCGWIVERGNPLVDMEAKYRFISRMQGRDVSKRPETSGLVELSPENVSLGEVRKGERIDTTVTLHNLSPDSIRVLKIRSSCSCTVAEIDKSPIASGDTREIKVTYTADKIGPARRNILIYLSSQQRPMQLVLTVEVVE